jgi:ABC-2 type transport system permease protein
MDRSLYTVLTFVKINTKRFFRDKLAIFFTVIFPLIFLFVFGSLNGGNGDISFRVAIFDQSNSQIGSSLTEELKKNKIFKVDTEVTTPDEAKDKMTRSQLDAVIIMPGGFGQRQAGEDYPSGQANIIYTQNNEQSARALSSILEAQFKAINAKFVDTDMPFSVRSIQLNERSLKPFDYTFAGLLGFAIIGMGIFGPVNVFPELKKMGILRRLSTTPLKVWQYFLATMIGQAVVGVLSLSIMFIVAITVFKLNVVGNYFELAFFLLLGVMTILGIGLALGGWAKNERQAAPLSNIIVFPMMFLSGTFFPRFLMPEWLQTVSNFLPLTPIIDGIRLIATEGAHLVNIGAQLGLIGLWMIIIYAIAFRVFRWE